MPLRIKTVFLKTNKYITWKENLLYILSPQNEAHQEDINIGEDTGHRGDGKRTFGGNTESERHERQPLSGALSKS